MRGQAALIALGDRVPQAARLNGMAPAELEELLMTDRTMWLDADARLFVRDTTASLALDGDEAGAADTGAGNEAFASLAPLSQTFSLHSMDASALGIPPVPTVYLDFDGITLGDSRWTAPPPKPGEVGNFTQGGYDGYDTDGEPSTFGVAERSDIQQIWAQVSEDFAPFQVDVTTQDPGPLNLTRSTAGDSQYGIRVAVTDDPDARRQVPGCEVSCSVIGLAYVDVFDTVDTRPEYGGPAWIFTEKLGGQTRVIADVVSHEVGHTFGLFHTALPVSGLGASIMNSSITAARVTHWVNSGGVDEREFIATHGVRPVVDESGTSAASSRPYFAGARGVVGDATDVDWFRITECQAGATISAQPADVGPNLDLRVTLVDSAGVTVAADAPTTTLPNGGMGATVTVPVFGGPWFVVVDGVGSGFQGADQPFGFGYPDFGSLGAYTLDAVGCGVAAQPPSAPRDAVATTVRPTPTSTDGVTTMTWRAPASTGSAGPALIDYEVSLDDGPWTNPLGNGTSTSWTTDQARHTVAVRALNPAGAGPAVVLRSVSPQALVRVWTEDHGSTGAKYIHWEEDYDTGGSALERMEVWTDATGNNLAGWAEPGLNGGVDFSFLTLGTTYWLSVSNAAGAGPRTAFVARARPVPPGPVVNPSVVVDPVVHTAKFSWTRPLDDGGGPAVEYWVTLDSGRRIILTEPSHVFADVAGGEHVARVQAVNSAGLGPETSVAFTMPVDTPPAAVNDAYTTLEDTTLTVPAPGVLDNDGDVDGDTLTASSVLPPAHGTLNLNQDGSFLYTPDADFHGSDSFKYVVITGALKSNLATVSLTVTPVDDAPTVTVTPGACMSDKTAQGLMVLTLADVDTAAAGLVVTAASSNTALVSTKSLVITGTGQSRALPITAADKKKGSAIITVTVNDGSWSSTASVQVLVGTNDAEIMSGTTGVDALFGLSGVDNLQGLGGADLLCGGNGNDLIDGGDGDDAPSGDSGNDRLLGGEGADALTGGSGADFFSGGAGINTYADFTVTQGDTQG
jgi:hypothetical protein